ncbi:hypothetical protein [Hymenobacter persicinus]|uniref:Uncharacterized protein n=1 Tax=Hymenobacter persicinus TaxID=2025506 RepID=A0A4Q5LBP1_9BACT|nr:hypothetical protein [Hymenobacter persicinus]RYU79916.1 hypothetical protein EWM57_09530 [Hymenobacter persicinus]
MNTSNTNSPAAQAGNLAATAANGCGGSASNGCGAAPAPAPSPAAPKAAFVPLELHACMGLNACKGHDRFGTNSCAGSGYCATTEHVCHSLNNCRGQGGCGLYGSAEEQNQPGQNDCAWKGSCATPIQQNRFSTLGPNQGKSVWLRARQLFEERLTREDREVGTPPFPEGPPTWWLRTLGPFDGCGSSGNPDCSFGGGGNLCGVRSGQKHGAGNDAQ